MTPEERRMLEEVREVTLDNARVLKSLERANHVSMAFKAFYWLVIIGSSFGAYYLIQPYVDAVKGSINEITGTPQTSSIESLIE